MSDEAVATQMIADGEARCRALLTDPTLVRGGRVAPVWLDGQVAFIDHAEPAPALKLVDRTSGTVRFVLSIVESTGSAGPAGLSRAPSGELVVTGATGMFTFSAEDGSSRPLSDAERAVLLARVPGVARSAYPTILPPEMEAPSPDGAWIATLRDDDLWLRSTDGDADRRLTAEECADPRWSLAGAAWSPDSRRLAVLRIDERAVDRVPLVDWTGDSGKITWHPYMRASGAISEWRLHVIDIETDEIREIGGGDAGHFAYLHGFSADGGTLRFARMERAAKHVELLAYDFASGETRRLLREEAETFLYWPPVFILGGAPVRFLSDGRFLWLTEASGWQQIWLHAADGAPLRALTDGDWPVVDVAAIDEKAGAVFFRGQPDAARPYDVHLFRVSLDGGAPVQLSTVDGAHEFLPAPDGSHYVDLHSSVERPPQAELRDDRGALIATLSRADIGGLEALGWTSPERITVKAADGKTELYGLLYKPFDFDPARRYPIIEQIYAGPQANVVPHGFGITLPQALAQCGYVTLLLDARGTPGRGKAFQDLAVGHMGEYEIADHAAAIRQVAATRPWMDLSRTGVFGISYGGYFTVRAMIQSPDLYRSGVALAPAELGPGIMGVPIECYEGRPGEHPARYAFLRNTDKLAAIEGALMLICGTDDVNTPVEQTMAYSDALARLRKPFEQLIMPGCNHAFVDSRGQSHMDFVYAALLRHFARTLQPEG